MAVALEAPDSTLHALQTLNRWVRWVVLVAVAFILTAGALGLLILSLCGSIHELRSSLSIQWEQDQAKKKELEARIIRLEALIGTRGKGQTDIGRTSTHP